jgi:uncharacterized alpha-E superfamily protein
MNQVKRTRSMSTKGCTPDNTACEGLLGRLKNEIYHNGNWTNARIGEFIDRVDRYIRWYNEFHIKLPSGGLSPVEYRQTLGSAASISPRNRPHLPTPATGRSPTGEAASAAPFAIGRSAPAGRLRGAG